MTLSSLSAIRLASAQESYHPDKLRTLIGEYLGIDAKRVVDEAHFGDDLGVDWLDRLELMIIGRLAHWAREKRAGHHRRISAQSQPSQRRYWLRVQGLIAPAPGVSGAHGWLVLSRRGKHIET